MVASFTATKSRNQIVDDFVVKEEGEHYDKSDDIFNHQPGKRDERVKLTHFGLSHSRFQSDINH